MKTYIILTGSMGGISGGTGYVNNKTRFLQEKEWEVVVIDYCGLKNAPVVLDNLKPFANNRFSKLCYPPSLFTLSQVKKVIIKLSELVDKSAEQIVVESNTIILSLWGELLAKELNARHLIFIIGETKIIDSKELFNFYKFKYDHNEIFSIKKEMFELLFSPYLKIEDAENHFWSAGCTIPPQEIECPALDSIQKADYNIVVFSRYKGFFPSMITELCSFAKKHRDKTINLIFFGVILVNSLRKQLEEESNISCYYFESQTPVPKSLFRLADVVIAASGCANIAFRQGAKTISMDVISYRPIGILGYTTVSTTTADLGDKEDKSLLQLFEDIFVKHKYTGPYVLEKKYSKKGNAYQLTFVDGPVHFWSGDVRKIKRNVKVSGGLLKFFFYIGLEKIITRVRFALFNLGSRGNLLG